MQKVIISFRKVNEDALNELADQIIVKLTGNVNFPNLPFSAAQITNAKNVYEAALAKSKDGSTKDTTDKKNKRKDMEKMLHDNGQYINLIAQGDMLMLTGTGYPLSNPRTPVGILDAPPQPKLRTDNTPRVLKVNVKANNKAKIYVYLLARDPAPAKPEDEGWRRITDTASSIVIRNLESGQRYRVRVAYKATEDTLRFSEPVSIIVQ